MTTIKIDEFSTGIKTAGNVENWYSQGFTGEYMNRTIAEVPVAVQDAISSRLFAVAEGGNIEHTTLIGREVVDDEQQKAWSVLAVVTRGRDEWQRPFSAHRYFICDGEDNLPNLFKFWNEHKLVFNPFDVKNIGDFIEYMVETGNINLENLSQEHKEFLKQKAPIIVPYNVVMAPLIIDCIATAKVEEDGDLVSWAYQVEALEHPRTFKAIFPASEQAEQILRRVVASQPQVDRFVQDEPAIKKAISLLSQNKVKPEHLQTIEDALANPAIDEKYWLTMFDSQGASTAIKESSYSPQLVRLLTLRAMVISATLPQLFDWLNKKDKKDQIWTDSLNFQAKITQNLSTLPNLTATILQGIKFMAVKLLDSEEYLQNTAWLCIAEGGSWANVYKNIFREDLKNKLKNLNNQTLPLSSTKPVQWDSLFNKLLEHLRTGTYYLLKQYLIFVNLFFMTGDYKFAAIFCHVSQGEIPPELFKKLNPNYRDYKDIYGIRVYRKISIIEKIGGFIVPVYALVPLLIIAILGSGFATYFGADRWFRTKAYDSSLEIMTSQIMQQKVIKELKPQEKEVNQVLAKVLEDGFEQNKNQTVTSIEQLSCKVAKEIDPTNNCVVIPSPTTTSTSLAPVKPPDLDINQTNKASLEKIVNDLKSKLSPKSQASGEKTIKDTVFTIMKKAESDVTNFDYIYSKSQGDKTIEKYQKLKNLDIDGTMNPDVAKQLKCDVVKELGNKYFPNSVSGCN